MNALDVLKQARALIADEKRWTKWASARTVDGIECCPSDAMANKWCASGAVCRVSPLSGCDAARDALHCSAMELYPATYFEGGYVYVNDTIGHAAVMRVFDHAISTLESRA